MQINAFRTGLRGAVLALSAGALAGCSWFGDDEVERIPGTRVAVLDANPALTPDVEAGAEPFVMPAESLDEWPQDGGNAQHNPQRLAGGGGLGVVWSSDIGAGSDSEERLLVQPIVANGRIYAIDADGELVALDAAGGREVWRVDLIPEDEDEGELGGGIAFADDTLFVTTGSAEAMALEPADGTVVWRVPLPGPSRSAPTVDAGRVFAVSADNRAVALDAATGQRLWSHSGAAEEAGILGSASAAVDGSVVVVPYTSGEVYAMRVENGRVLWSDRLVAPRATEAIARIAHIRARPIIGDARLFVVSHSGRSAALDMRTGSRVWEQPAGGASSPWLAGNTLFLVTDRAEVVSLSETDGRIRWVTQLQRYEDMEDQEDPIDWVGPILVGDRLIVAGSNGVAVAMSPSTGEPVDQRDIGGAGFRIEPLAAGGTIYLLADDARLYALR
ncbi:MAG: PQQ-binding-like beta-propeller repeat protein [Alphaproteobacteria bacterium]